VLARAEAVVGSKRGPSVLQPYRDLAKLLRKGSMISDQASWIFRGAPFVVFACYLTVSVIVPIISSDPLALAFRADLIGGAFVLMLGQLHDLAGRAGHRQPARRARREPRELDRAAWPSQR
jgi:formate hydrogenlyase subunit 4